MKLISKIIRLLFKLITHSTEKEPIFIKPKRKIHQIFIHCSDSDKPSHDDILIIKEWHLKRGFKDVGYHYFIKKDGTIQKGRDLEKIPSAQKGYNYGTIAICVSGSKEFTNASFNALNYLCSEIRLSCSNITFHAHNEVNSNKTCPNFNICDVLDIDKFGRFDIG